MQNNILFNICYITEVSRSVLSSLPSGPPPGWAGGVPSSQPPLSRGPLHQGNENVEETDASGILIKCHPLSCTWIVTSSSDLCNFNNSSNLSLSPQVKNMSSTQEQSPPPAWWSTCARAKRRRTRRRGQSNRLSRPDVPTGPRRSSTRGASLPAPARPPDRHLSPRHTCPLSLVSALTESVDAPHFSSTTSKKNQPTNIAQRRCLWGSVAMEWGGLKGWMRITHNTLITFCGQPWGGR